MYFFHAITSDGDEQETSWSAAREFRSLAPGCGAWHEYRGSGSLSVIGIPDNMRRNRGVYLENDTLYIVPYGLYTEDGQAHDLSVDRSRSLLKALTHGQEAFHQRPAAPFCAIAIDQARPKILVRQDFIGSGLSGGRDSRLIAAAFHPYNNVYLKTINRFEDETDVARSLVERMGVGERHSVAEESSGPGKQWGLLESGQSLVRQYDGLHDATYAGLRVPPPPSRRLVERPLMISGAAGEMIHGHYYPRSGPPVDALSASEAIDHLFASFRPGGIAAPGCRELFESRVREWALAGAGMSGVRILDYFYLYERQRRWSGISAEFNVLAPMATPTFCLGSFALEATDFASSGIPQALAENIVPAIRGIPYFKATHCRAIRRAELTQQEARNGLDLVGSSNMLRGIVDVAKLERVVSDWDALPAKRRDPIVKRATWLGLVVEELGAR